jgi:hypothetical protein
MTTYKGINGFAVQSVASDPSPLDEGQVWYNNTSYAWKLASVTTSGTWATSGNMNQARGAIGSAGTFTAGLAVGAYYPYGNNVEKYSGSVWTNSTAYPVTELAHIGGCGPQTAALMAGGGGTGGNNSTVNKFDGTTWTSATAIPTATEAGNLFGIQTAAIFFGGGTPPGGYPASAFSFNGSSWTSSPSLNNSNRYGSLATGTNTAGLAAGGGYPTISNTELYNGSAWTNSGAIPFSTYNVSGSNVGTQGAAMLWFGNAPANTTTQYFNGSSWSNQSATLTYGPMGGKAASGGTQSAAFSGSGDPAKSVATTNNWTGAGSPVTKTITTS